jgi:NAD-dependent dihydropyrimidine dehydrogenase PreA subunit
VDAVVGMEGNGPASPDLRDIGRILASDNPVALDATIARMMDLEPAKLRFMQRAREMGLGDFEKGTIEVIGELAAIPGFKLPPLGGEAIAGSEAVREFMHSPTLLRPKADPEKCTACGTCVEQCSVSALSMEDDLPVVDADTCITCFCCQEICPEKAITLQLP